MPGSCNWAVHLLIPGSPLMSAKERPTDRRPMILKVSTETRRLPSSPRGVSCVNSKLLRRVRSALEVVSLHSGRREEREVRDFRSIFSQQEHCELESLDLDMHLFYLQLLSTQACQQSLRAA